MPEKILKNGIVFALLLGLIFPQGKQLSSILPYLIGVILFLCFIKLEFEIKNFYHSRIWIFLSIYLILSPVLMFFIGKVFGLSPDLALGFLLIAITPVASGSSLMVNLLKGRQEIVATSLIVTSFLAPFVYSFYPHFFFGNSIAIDPWKIFWKASGVVITPFILAFVLKGFHIVKRLVAPIQKLNPIFYFLLIYVAAASSADKLRAASWQTLALNFAIIGTLNIGLYFIGYKISKSDSSKRTWPFIFGQKNTSLTTWIILANFNSTALIPVVTYIIFQNFSNSFLIGVLQKKTKKV